MTLLQLRDDIRRQSKITSNDLSDATLNVIVNKYYDILLSIVSDLQEDRLLEKSTADLVADQQEYTLPTDIMRLKRIEVTYDGTDTQVATAFDINERGNPDSATDTTTISNEFSTDEPFYDQMDYSFFLYPIPSTSITGGLTLWYVQRPVALSADGDSPDAGIPQDFHYLLVEGPLKDVFRRFRKNDQEDRANANWERGKVQFRELMEPFDIGGSLAFKAVDDYGE